MSRVKGTSAWLSAGASAVAKTSELRPKYQSTRSAVSCLAAPSLAHQEPAKWWGMAWAWKVSIARKRSCG